MPNMGNEAPNTSSTGPIGLADALFTQTQQRVLALLFGQDRRDFSISELISGSGAGSGAVQREVAKLVASGLVEQRRVGNQKRYRAFAGSPIHAELVALVHKTIGLAQPLREALQPLQDQIALAFVFGSVAKRTDSAHSDIDLMLVSDTLGYAELMAVLDPLEDRLGRPVNPTLYTHDELHDRLRKGNAFLQRVLEQPKVWVIGGKDDLGIAESGRAGKPLTVPTTPRTP